jgi:hypothetical protein
MLLGFNSAFFNFISFPQNIKSSISFFSFDPHFILQLFSQYLFGVENGSARCGFLYHVFDNSVFRKYLVRSKKVNDCFKSIKMEKPEAATSGYKEELPQITGSSTTTSLF